MELTDLYRIDNFIDTFAPGHYARVLDAQDKRQNRTVAFKVLRPEHLMADGDMRWEYRAFANEAEILHKLGSNAYVVRLYDCGYVATHEEAPADGDIESLGTDVATFRRQMADFAHKGWRPYLTLEHMPRTENLFYAMKPNQGNARRRLPSEEGITLAWQFVQVLREAHSHQIVYLDHKLEHVYWDGLDLRVIDFNSSRQLLGGAADQQEYAKDVHNLCVGILYPVFTGMSPQKSSLRPQPGGMDVVESRYQEITELDFMMEPSLSQALRDLLQRGAAMQLTRLDEFSDALQEVAALHGQNFPLFYTSPATRDARTQLQQGLQRLREGEDRIREARDMLREALILDDISEDMENELRRLIKAANDMLNHRVIP
jgi:serine/threonine protein kinase